MASVELVLVSAAAKLGLVELELGSVQVTEWEQVERVRELSVSAQWVSVRSVRVRLGLAQSEEVLLVRALSMMNRVVMCLSSRRQWDIHQA